jgi:riboflavin kinase/FMN adenylyltransferase
MRLLEGFDALDQADLARHGDTTEGRSAVAVGVFDGVHLGHLRLLQELLELASETHALPTVVTFRDHPDAVIRGSAPEPIVSLPHRLRLLRRAGVRRVLLLDFDERVRALSAVEFTDRVLVRGLQTKGLLLGFDSAIGRDREGTPQLLRSLGERHGFVVREAQPFFVDGQRVSSTAIRAAIGAGDLALSQRLLGRWPSTFGTVEHGAGRGKGLGFATANLAPQSCVLPPRGVYAVEVIHDGETFAGVANLGARPTFADASPAPASTLEVHLLDWSGDLYGSTLEVCFVRRLRDERKFQDGDALSRQIRADIAHAREVFAS